MRRIKTRKMKGIFMAALLIVNGFLAMCRAAQLSVGLASENAREEIEPFNRLTSYVKMRMKKAGVSKISVFVAQTPHELLEGLKKKKIDWASTSSLWGLMLARETGADVVLRRWKDG